MNNSVVVYKSRYGATQKYAKWIADELSCDLCERNHVKPADLERYDTIIYGGGLYAGGVNGIDLLTKHFDRLYNKNLIVFTCGLANPLDKDNADSIRNSLNKVLPSQMREKIKVFHLRGAIDYSQLGPIHKAMMAMLHKMTIKKDVDSLREEDRQMLETYGKTVDFTDKATILPIVRFVQEL